MARMDKVEARALLDQKVRELRQLSYAELQRFQEPVVFELTGPSGAWYQIEVEAFWDDRRDNNLRVLAAIDDGGWSAIHPMTDDFIIAPNGTFVGE